MASSLILSPQFPSQTLYGISSSHRPIFLFRHNFYRTPLPPLQASRPISNFPQKGDNFVGDPRDWKRNLDFYGGEDEIDDEDDEEEEEEDRSLDLLTKFVQNVFKKISRKARKAVRSVLPINISTKLQSISLDSTKLFSRKLMLANNYPPSPELLSIEPHDYMAKLFDSVVRFNNILIDFDKRHLGLYLLGLLQAGMLRH